MKRETLQKAYGELQSAIQEARKKNQKRIKLSMEAAKVLRRMTAAAETTPPAKPAYEEIVTGLERAIEHLDYCGWGDSWEREVSEELRKDLPALLERAKA